jgi:chloramphenicol 3-O-phosphotransferase
MDSRPISAGPRALLLNGTVGVGKSSLAEAIAALLSTRRIPNAYLDMDEVRRKWPAPADDPFNSALAMQNLASLSSNFVRAGVERLVLAGVMETGAELEGYSSAVGMPLVTCRLTVEADVLRNRLRARHFDDAELRWHLARAPELAQILDAASLEDFCVDVTATPVSEAATEVAGLIGWIR